MISELLQRCFSQERFDFARDMATAYDSEIDTPMTAAERSDFLIGFQLGMIAGKVNTKKLTTMAHDRAELIRLVESANNPICINKTKENGE